MAKPVKKNIAELTGSKAVVAVSCGIALCIAILILINWVATHNKKSSYFSYGTSDSRNDLVHVVDNKRVEVPLFFEVGKGISEVSLTLSGKHAEMIGLEISDETVSVVNGQAASTMIIQFNSKTALRAGSHFLTIVARNTSTGKIIRKGEIQINYNMHELIGKCSC